MRDLFWASLARIPDGFWWGLTWLGDTAFMLPAALLIGLWLLMARRTLPTAMLWALCFGTASLIVLVSKLAFLGWGIGSARLNFTGFSGHSALSASVWPVALWLLASRASHALRVAAAGAGAALALAIGLSRLALYAHSVSEVASGLALGLAASGLFLVLQHRRAHPHLWWPLVLLSLMAPLVLQTPGVPAPTQSLLEQIAVRLAGIDRPWTREDLLQGRG